MRGQTTSALPQRRRRRCSPACYREEVVPRPLHTWISLLERLCVEERAGLEPLEDLLADLRRWASVIEGQGAAVASEPGQRFARLGSQPTAAR